MVRFMDCYVATMTSGVRTFTVAPEARVMMVRLWNVVRFMDCYVAPVTSGLRTFTVAPEAGTMMLACDTLRLSIGHVMMMMMMMRFLS